MSVALQSEMQPIFDVIKDSNKQLIILKINILSYTLDTFVTGFYPHL